MSETALKLHKQIHIHETDKQTNIDLRCYCIDHVYIVIHVCDSMWYL